MKTDRLNDIVDNIILVTLLFVPFVILIIIELAVKFINLFRKRKNKSILD